MYWSTVVHEAPTGETRLFAATLGLVIFAKKIAEPLIILSAGVLGVVLRSLHT